MYNKVHISEYTGANIGISTLVEIMLDGQLSEILDNERKKAWIAGHYMKIKFSGEDIAVLDSLLKARISEAVPPEKQGEIYNKMRKLIMEPF